MLIKKTQYMLRTLLGLRDFLHLRRNVIEVNNIAELKKIFRWELDPIIDDPIFQKFEYVEDLNERRLRDAEILGCVCRNINKGNMLEIGTSIGHGTALMAMNAPNACIYTVNIPQEEILSGRGGKLTTIALEKAEIGSYYRNRGINNVVQIFANTATWKPNINSLEVAFIDGCHDMDFVFNDTKIILPFIKQHGFILWHDFNPSLLYNYNWISEVCRGIEKLYTKEILQGNIFHVKDSWIGIHQLQ